MEPQSDFLISSPEKIFSKLSILLKHKNLLTAVFGNRGQTFVSSILDINKKNNVFICDGCDEEFVEQVLSSSKIIFKTEHMGASITFDSGKISKTEYEGVLAFTVPIPSTMRWVEQREFYRMRIPSSAASSCQLTLNGHGTLNLRLYDISVRGFSMVNVLEDISGLLVAGTQFEKCKLILEDKQEMEIAFEIRSNLLLNANNLNKMEKIGCKFTQLTPALENTVHSYMLQIERELLKKRAENVEFARY